LPALQPSTPAAQVQLASVGDNKDLLVVVPMKIMATWALMTPSIASAAPVREDNRNLRGSNSREKKS
jgi:hypothetical protein